jgi:hypothetical protein
MRAFHGEAGVLSLDRRKASQSDIPFLLALRRETMDSHLAASGVDPTDAYHEARVMYRFECAEILLLAGHPVGLLKLRKPADGVGAHPAPAEPRLARPGTRAHIAGRADRRSIGRQACS